METWYTSITFSWLIDDARIASFKNRSLDGRSVAIEGARTLIATLRPNVSSTPSNTNPVGPVAISLVKENPLKLVITSSDELPLASDRKLRRLSVVSLRLPSPKVVNNKSKKFFSEARVLLCICSFCRAISVDSSSTRSGSLLL